MNPQTMNYLKKSTFYLTKSQRWGILSLFILILLFEVISMKSFQKDHFTLSESDKVLLDSFKINSASIKQASFANYKKATLDTIKPFNPNNYTQEDWMKLGFSERQAEVILKYKGIVGGNFTNKEQIKKCYVIDEVMYNKLAPFILLPEKGNSTFEQNYTKPKINYSKFNPNDLPQQGWEKFGFSPKQAETIMKYKQIVGGKFTSKEQIRKCYVISDEKYEEMQAYILLPERSKQDEKLTKQQTKTKINYSKFNPNDYSVKEWQQIGFSMKQAEGIIKYKMIVGGRFRNKEQLKKCYMISDEKYAEMKAKIKEKLASKHCCNRNSRRKLQEA